MRYKNILLLLALIITPSFVFAFEEVQPQELRCKQPLDEPNLVIENIDIGIEGEPEFLAAGKKPRKWTCTCISEEPECGSSSTTTYTYSAGGSLSCSAALKDCTQKSSADVSPETVSCSINCVN